MYTYMIDDGTNQKSEPWTNLISIRSGDLLNVKNNFVDHLNVNYRTKSLIVTSFINNCPITQHYLNFILSG